MSSVIRRDQNGVQRGRFNISLPTYKYLQYQRLFILTILRWYTRSSSISVSYTTVRSSQRCEQVRSANYSESDMLLYATSTGVCISPFSKLRAKGVLCRAGVFLYLVFDEVEALWDEPVVLPQ